MRRLLSALAVLLFVPSAAGATPALGTTTLFETVPAPGMPEGIAVVGGRVYVGTHVSARGNIGEGPSRVFAYDATTGSPLGSYTIAGQDTSKSHGLTGMTTDGRGRLYIADHSVPARVLRIDPATGLQETYATIPDLPPCLPEAVAPGVMCTPTIADLAAFPDGLAFDAAGNLYVSDLEQATIWRVPPGGGNAAIWFSDARLDAIFGPNGLAMDASRTHVYFAMTGSQQPETLALGIIYRLPVVSRPDASSLETFHTFAQPVDGPDGIAFGASGKMYVALAGSNGLAVLNPDGTEQLRVPSDPIANEQMPVPYDTPASPTFDGHGSLLLTNQSYFAADASHWAVLKIWVDDVAP